MTNLEHLLRVYDAAITGDDPGLYGRPNWLPSKFAKSDCKWALSGYEGQFAYLIGRLELLYANDDMMDRFYLPRFSNLRCQVVLECRKYA